METGPIKCLKLQGITDTTEKYKSSLLVLRLHWKQVTGANSHTIHSFQVSLIDLILSKLQMIGQQKRNSNTNCNMFTFRDDAFWNVHKVLKQCDLWRF